MHLIRKIYNPSLFQGSLTKKRYFEGWYYKLVSADHQKIAVIPGIAIVGKNHPDNHSFIQFIDGNSGNTAYFRYDLAEFRSSDKVFQIQVGESTFSQNQVNLNITTGKNTLQGSVTFDRMQSVPSTLFSPGIMGWYRFVPFMECYHGIISMTHEISGEIHFNGSRVDFSRGKGYIEKDWGRSFPSSYIWLQSNHFFEEQELSFMLSIARIPWLNGYFIGFLSVIYFKESMHRFTTYTGARISKIHIIDHQFTCSLEDGSFIINIEARGKTHVPLLAPTIGSMDRVIKESMDSSCMLQIFSKEEKKVLFEGEGRHAGFEMAGDMNIILNNFQKKSL